MSAPAGWYDDGSGRQRWWDGSRWTENYAPAGDGAAADGPAASAGDLAAPAAGSDADAAPAHAPVAPASTAPAQAPTLGFIGLGLAVLGTVLVCIPNFVTFGIGSFVLLAAFVVSLIAVFKRGTVKWPSIVGIALSVVGGIVGVVVLLFTIAATAIANIPDPPTDLSTSATSTQPSDPPATGDSEGRPSAEAIGKGWKILINEGGFHQYDDNPEFFTCIGEHFYDSDVSDEVLRDVAQGVDNTTGAVKDHAVQVGLDATVECDASLQKPTDQ
ncbi:DUF2510 domain-containing protein [Microbacterium sp. 69-10]|uniref:DUF2510 domain-containing protein n=1 Tax=Microbacterium sp. 69-10 TaxID=1895783 RepID=UPI0025F32CEC|nr:DUF2510 domain-containing protein [Microbacterium sp. 69-10]